MTGSWSVRLLALSVIAGVVAMHSLVGLHAAPSLHESSHTVTASRQAPSAAPGGDASSNEARCVGHGCASGVDIAMCIALVISALLAAVARRTRVWAAPSWDLRLSAGCRAIRRREWVGTPSPGRLGISRT